MAKVFRSAVGRSRVIYFIAKPGLQPEPLIPKYHKVLFEIGTADSDRIMQILKNSNYSLTLQPLHYFCILSQK